LTKESKCDIIQSESERGVMSMFTDYTMFHVETTLSLGDLKQAVTLLREKNNAPTGEVTEVFVTESCWEDGTARFGIVVEQVVGTEWQEFSAEFARVQGKGVEIAGE